LRARARTAFRELGQTRFGELGPTRFRELGQTRFGELGPTRFGELGQIRFPELGQGFVEYGLILSGSALVALVLLLFLGPTLSAFLQVVGDAIDAAT
jgi:hypothetical protein